MDWVALLVIGFLCMRLLVALFNLLSRPWLPEGVQHGQAKRGTESADDGPLVSVLIPARNEEHNIGSILQDIIDQDYKNMEVLVYDDLSEDHTAKVVKAFSEKDARIRLIPGQELPAGWLGKNHACHNLSLQAKGHYLLFLDADVRIGPGLISMAVSHMKKHQLALLSIFPQQIMKSFGERITVPLMNWVLVSLLPLKLTRLSPWPSFSAANGQFMLFDAQVYAGHRFHREVRTHNVEDILIFRLMKKRRLKAETMLSNGMIRCRMYDGFGSAVQGFSRNVFGFFGEKTLLSGLFTLLTTLGFLPVYWVYGLTATLVFLFMGWLLRIMIAVASRQPVFPDVFLAPLQQIAFLAVIMKASHNKIYGKMTWKGRQVPKAHV